jgi:hypothetical protein
MNSAYFIVKQEALQEDNNPQMAQILQMLG